MAVNTLPRDYDLARIIDDYERRISFLERLIRNSPVAASIWQNVPGGFDTGWQLITAFNALYTPQAGGNAPMVRRYGPVVSVKGRCTTTAAIVASGTIYTLPAGFGFEPTGVIHEAGRSFVAGAASAAHRYFVGVGGVGEQQGAGGLGVGAGATVALSTTWMVELP